MVVGRSANFMVASNDLFTFVIFCAVLPLNLFTFVIALVSMRYARESEVYRAIIEIQKKGDTGNPSAPVSSRASQFAPIHRSVGDMTVARTSNALVPIPKVGRSTSLPQESAFGGIAKESSRGALLTQQQNQAVKNGWGRGANARYMTVGRS